MKKGISLWLPLMVGITTVLILFHQIGKAASSSPTESASCQSFGVQRFEERKEAPHFSLIGLDGKHISLSDYKGKPVLITFWATWCAACKEDIPLLEKFSAEKRDQVTVLLIAIDGERKKAIQKVVHEKKVTLPVLLLLKEKCMDQYGVKGWVPQTFLVNREGMLVGKIVGQRDWCSPEAWSCLKEILELR